MRLGLGAHERFPLDLRHIGTITMGLDEAAWQKLQERIQSFRKDLIEIAEQVQSSDRVCQINLQAFPLTVIPACKATDR